MPTSEFYHDLAPCRDFAAALAGDCFVAVPDDWIVVATDVVDSTRAIEDGHYKDVTVAGAVSTISVANITGSLDFPFFFGGDGMVFLLPDRYRRQVTAVLSDVRRVVRATSGLELRAGILPVKTLRTMGADIAIGKVRITARYTQAVASGSALALVDEILKGRVGADMEFPPEASEEDDLRADFRGFSCRWQDIPSRFGETMSLIVEQTGTTDDGRSGLQAAQAVVDEIVRDQTRAHPLSVQAQVTRSSAAVAGPEAHVRARGRRGLRVVLQRLRIGLEVAAVRFALATGLPLRGEGKRLRDVREDNIRNADVYKIDGTLKMTLAISPGDRRQLVERLESLRREGAIRFGWHTSDRAIMTCLIHTNHEDEVHFVDSADGGYAAAAKMLKASRNTAEG